MIIGSGCAHPSGPAIRVCIVDAQANEMDCYDETNKEQIIPIDEGRDLECATPFETEQFLKACKVGKVIKVTLCKRIISEQSYQCLTPQGYNIKIDMSVMNNYVCIHPNDRKRLEERCRV